jgi:alanine racemase
MAPSHNPTRGLPCWLDIGLDALAHNVRALGSWVGPQTQIAAVVKAQGYGVGAEEVARTALNAGATWLAVARVHEGKELRRAGITAPILVLTRTDESEADAAVRHDLALTVDCADLARALGAAAKKHRRPARAHVKVDTGLHRFGVDPDQALPLARILSEIDGVEPQALYTHFANADEEDSTYTLQQLACFHEVARRLSDAGYRFPVKHAANSAATLAFPEAHFSLVRVGLALYGTSPMGTVPPGLDLRPAVALRARIARVTCLAPGEGVGYGQIWHAERPSRIALATAGYADGIPRQLSNVGEALVRGRRVPIVGRVSMDQTTLDVTDVPGVEVGDVATFFGDDGAASIDLNQFAEQAGTIAHTALTGIGGRVARVYHRDGFAGRAARLAGTTDISL